MQALLLVTLLIIHIGSGNCKCASKFPQQCQINYYKNENLCANHELPRCPEGFQETDEFCYLITPKTKFPPNCPFDNLVEFDAYSSILDSINITVWMPVRRDTSNGIGNLVWLERGKRYKEEFSETYNMPDHIKGLDCLIRYQNTYLLVSCDEEYNAICAYQQLDQLSNDLCEESSHSSLCVQADFDSRIKCFCLGEPDQKNLPKVEFLQPYQNRIYERLTYDNCAIALTRSHGDYIWNNSKIAIDYCYWNPDNVFNEEDNFGAITPAGWILTPNPLDCFLYESQVLLNETSLILDEHLNLNIINSNSLLQIDSEPMVFCFTNGGALSLIYRYNTLIKIDNDHYQIQAHLYGPGFYWCEAIKSDTLQTIRSEMIFHNQTSFGEEYIAILKMQYFPGTNPIGNNQINFLMALFTVKLPNYNSRVMKFIDLDEMKHEVHVNVHFTENLNRSKDFIPLEQQIREILQQLSNVSIDMIKFLSASYCFEEPPFWPQTPINTNASKEYCFDSNGLRVQRSCNGNFSDGAEWASPPSCEPVTQSMVTQELLKIIYEPTLVETIHEILRSRFEEFASIDVYLVASILQEGKVTNASDVLENVLKIPDSILNTAQSEMRAMDMILEAIDNLIDGINSDNFPVYPHVIGVVERENGGVATLAETYSSDELLRKYPDLLRAIWLTSNQEATFILYTSDNFFKCAQHQTSRNVFGIKILEKPRGDVKVLAKNTKQDFCAFWKYDLQSSNGRGFWHTISDSGQISSFIECTFNDTKSVGFALVSPANVTDHLNDLLGNQDPVYVITQLSNISDRYEEFTAHDIYLVGEILDQISAASNLNLTLLAHIVSNLHEIKKVILRDSQRLNKATDIILRAVDNIIKNQNFTEVINIIEKNFGIFVTDFQEDFSGLVLLENDSIEIRILEGNVSLNTLFTDELNCALILSPQFKKQLPDDIIITIAIFSSDGLFNEEETAAIGVSKIFGVFFSLEFGKFQNPLSFIYKLKNTTEDSVKSCVHWAYDDNVLGSWHEDDHFHAAEYNECKFWHTTHFALLLLDSLQCDSEILEWITTIGSGLSMFGLLSIILTAILFKRWRTNSGNQILLNFVLASILQIITFFVSTKIKKYIGDRLICTIIGAILHYSIISQFCWMFVIAVLQFKRFVEVLTAPPKHVLLKGCICGWLLPLLPVLVVYFLDDQTYTDGKVGLCYPSGLGLYLGVWLPIAIVIAVNLIIFVFIIYSVVHKKTECSDVNSNDVMFQWRLAILLFFMLGTTWIFGFLAESFLIETDFSCVFVYVFCITATLQGFVMFLFFIVFNANTRYLYLQALKSKKRY